MTSKRLFFKVMQEDLRHKIWMIALSILGSFLALPVAWLMLRSNIAYSTEELLQSGELTGKAVTSALDFYSSYVPWLGGIVAMAGAVVTGIFGFWYVFHKNMVDTWHSLPIKRSILYMAGYVNGLLIWFVPFLVNLVLSMILAGSFVYKISDALTVAALFKEALVSLAVLGIVYLLVYHLVLVAVMLCGNLLNTLVCIVILGLGAVILVTFGVEICAVSLDTFSMLSYPYETAVYASPLFSGIYLIYLRVKSGVSFGRLWEMSFVNLAIAVVLGLCAWLLYKRRASEIAEQGIRNKIMAAALKIAASVTAGMSGWQIFIILTEDNNSLVWGSFGAVLAVIIVFGVLNMVFQMDFKAFFAHKLQMTVTVGLILFIGFSIHEDWFGYDTYLPKKDAIAEIAIYDSCFTNRLSSEEYLLDNMSFQDIEVIYPYLERMVEREQGETTDNFDVVTARVTLTNGRSYYRKYKICAEDKELVWPMFASEEYLKYAYCLSDEEIACSIPDSYRGIGNGVYRNDDWEPEVFHSILQAYNQDVLENPDTVLFGRGRMLSLLNFTIVADGNANGRYTSVLLYIYENMEHTLEALKLAGCEEFITVPESSQISSIELLLWTELDEVKTSEEMIDKAREYYGVYGKDWEEKQKNYDEKIQERAETIVGSSGVRNRREVSITDGAEIEELLSYITFGRPISQSVLREEWVEIEYVSDDKARYCYIPKGILPEKYILRFGELLQTQEE